MEQAFCDAVLTPEFWQGVEQQRPVHIPGAAPTLPAAISTDDVVEALTVGSSSGQTSAHKRGEPYMRENYFLAYLDAASLSLSEAEHHFSQLLALCRALAPTFDFVRARLVLDPPDSPASLIVAESDSIAVQLWGERRVSLFPQISGLPVTAPRPDAYLKPTLRPGDALYVPRGVECRVAGPPPGPPTISEEPTTAGPVLYAVLTVGSSDQSLGMSLGKYLTDLLVQGPFSEDADGFFRSAITRHTLPDRYAKGEQSKETAAGSLRAELEARLSRCADELVSRMTAVGLRAHYNQRMGELRDQQLAAAGKVRATRRLPPDSVVSTSVVRVSRGVSLRCAVGDKVARFTRGTETLNLPIAPTASGLFNALSDGEPHKVGSLPCEDPFERICVCQVLVFKGCVDMAASGDRER